MEYRIAPPGEFPQKDLAAFYKMAEAGGQVKLRGLPGRINRARLLAVAYEGDMMAGIAALKRPADTYKHRVFAQAGTPAAAEKYPYEIGYAYTLPEHRKKGIHSALLQALIDAFPEANIFATTKAANVPGLLIGKGFEKAGNDFANDEGDVLQLFTLTR